MIEHAGNTCTVGYTSLTFTTTSKQEISLLEGFGFNINNTYGRPSCYVDCKISWFLEHRQALIVACEISGVKYDLPEIPKYAQNHSQSKLREFEKEINNIIH